MGVTTNKDKKKLPLMRTAPVSIGKHLAAVVDIAARDDPEFKRVRGKKNLATYHIVDEILDCLDDPSIWQPGSFPYSFVAVVGDVLYEIPQFPDDKSHAVAEVIRQKMSLLSRGAANQELVHSEDEYSFKLRGFESFDKAEEWIESYIRSNQLGSRNRVLTPELQELIRKAVARAADGLEDNYDDRRQGLAEISDLVREEIAKVLGPILNERARQFPQSTYEEKKELAKWVNAELRRFGLAIKTPKTGRPCLIVATTGRDRSVGRFVLDYTDENGRRHHPSSSATLPALELMLDDLTRATYGQHRSVVR